MEPLNIFYEDLKQTDRWFKHDRFIRWIIRRIIRGKKRPSGQDIVFLNLIKGLKRINVPFRINDYKFIKKNPKAVACIIGRDHVLFENKWVNPIVFGAAFGINPIANPTILEDFPIKKIVVPGPWVKKFFEPYGAKNIAVWPVGIDTEEWNLQISEKKIDFLIYNKIRWDVTAMKETLLEPLKAELIKNQFTFTELKYGYYQPHELKLKIKDCRYALFICESETQGIAYQQMLSSNMPVLAWDAGGFWKDPFWYPDKIQFSPVSSVPYWSKKCGEKFTSLDDFPGALRKFINQTKQNYYQPRNYILDNLSLEISAQQYVKIVSSVIKNGTV